MMYFYKTFVFCIVLIFNGCASFNNQVRPPLVSDLKEKSKPQKSIGFFIDMKDYILVNGERYDYLSPLSEEEEGNSVFPKQNLSRKEICHIISEELLNSGYFKIAEGNQKMADLILLVNFTWDVKRSLWHNFEGILIKTLTLHIFPTKDTHSWDFEIFVLDKNGKKLAEYHILDSYNEWYWLFFLPIAYSHSTGKAKAILLSHIMRELVMKMKEGKIL